MTTKFKNHFIVLDWTQESLDRAIEKAREMGYGEWENWLTDFTSELNILELDDDWDYYLGYNTKQNLINLWYTELKLQPKPHYVYVSDESIEDALKQKDKWILITDLWEQFNDRYIVIADCYEEEYLNWEKNINYEIWEYIAEIPKTKKVTLELTEEQLEKIKEIMFII